jgi:DNA-binding CsgD family transcriptional regulator
MAADATRDDPGLLEREVELGLLGELVSRARAGEGALAFVEGQAGVGKTELLRVAAKLGAAEGLRVLRARGSELDRAFAFGVVRQLLEREVADQRELLTGGAEPAAAVFAPAGGEPRVEEGLFASLQGLHWLVVNLAAREPLLLLIDDVHWADTASLRWLVFLAERVEDVQALVVSAARPAEPGADQELLDALMMAPAASVLRPAPLSAGATTTVVCDRLPGAVDAFAAACHRATGGNPFLLGELLGELAAAGVRGGADEAGQVPEFGSERVGRAVRRRLRLLPAEATSVAGAVAVLGPDAPLDEVAALAGVDDERTARAADALARIHVLAAERGLDFVHPVVRSAVYEQIPPLERQTLHARAAELLATRGAEDERVARHLLRLRASADPGRVAVLRAAAREARARGAAEAAAGYLRRALEEPPASEERGAVLYELGVAEATDRQRDRFEGHLREAMALTRDPRARAQIALELGRALLSCGDYRASVEVLDDALRRLDDRDGELGVALEAELLVIAIDDFLITELAAPHWERRLRQLEAGAELDPATLACLVMKIAVSRPPATAAIRLAERVLAASRLDELNSAVAAMVGNGLIYGGAPSRAGRFYDEAIATATRRGSRLALSWQLMMRSDASLRLGEVRRAEAEARSALELSEEGSGEPALAFAVAYLLNALLARGALDEAEALVGRGIVGPSAPPSYPVALLLTARANLHLAQGRASAALIDARAAGDLVSGTISNPACSGWRSPAALALAALGRDEEARAMAESELADARRFAVPDAEGTALRTLGLVAGGKEGLDALRASVAVLEPAEGRLEHARSLLELGAALRRAGERVEARDVLREALDAAARMGASGLADRAHEELIAAGARPRRDRRLLSGRESLTASEDRVAVLAAEGLTNREIAQRQFVTVKAVPWHLGNVYRKLDISSREELPEALGLAPQDKTLGHVG